MKLQWRAVLVAAAVIFAAVVGAVLAVRAASTEENSNLNLVVILFLLIAFPVGGVVAYRVAGTRPLAHAAAAAALAWVAITATVVSRGFTLSRVLTLALLMQVTIGLALLGGWVSYRRRRALESPAP
jgi:hypothetical protein